MRGRAKFSPFLYEGVKFGPIFISGKSDCMGWQNETIIWEGALKFYFEVWWLSRKCNYLYGGLEKVIICRGWARKYDCFVRRSRKFIFWYGGIENFYVLSHLPNFNGIALY